MNSIQPSNAVTHNEERHRFEFRDGSYLATLHYERDGNHVTFTHTYVPDAMRGRGAATKLSRGALHEARHRHWKVATRCPFVSVFLERNREFADLVESPPQGTDVPNDPSAERAASSLAFEPAIACEGCGRFGAYRIGDRALCDECIEGCGSCCPEFGKDDLWRDREL